LLKVALAAARRAAFEVVFDNLSGWSSNLEVNRLADVGDQVDPGGRPAQTLLRQSAGGRHVQAGEHRQWPVIIASLFFLDRNYRHIQRPADHFRALLKSLPK
jgi:hypothetical protein